MTKISPRQYASALYEYTIDLSGHELRAAISNFVKLLALKKDLRQINKIISSFEEIYNQNNNLASLEVKSARSLSENTLSQIKSYFKKELAQDIEISTVEDPSLIGGFTIKHGDTIIDASVSGALANLKKSLTR